MPVVSVIIPVYNGEKTIKKTIESVLKQTFTDFELIVVDANSTDSTFSIVSQIQDSRLRVYSYPRANVAVNRNRGFEHCLGKFVSFLDADDIWFLVTAVKYDKTLLFKPILYKALLKLAAMSFLSPKGATELLNRFPRLSDTSTFFGYIKVN